MAKGKKGQDAMDRICFLFNAAHALLRSSPNLGLICLYGHMIQMLARKTQTKLGPMIKRKLCKNCHVILHPGSTAEVSLKSKPAKHILISCKICKTVKRFTTSNYKLFVGKV